MEATPSPQSQPLMIRTEQLPFFTVARLVNGARRTPALLHEPSHSSLGYYSSSSLGQQRDLQRSNSRPSPAVQPAVDHMPALPNRPGSRVLATTSNADPSTQPADGAAIAVTNLQEGTMSPNEATDDQDQVQTRPDTVPVSSNGSGVAPPRGEKRSRIHDDSEATNNGNADIHAFKRKRLDSELE